MPVCHWALGHVKTRDTAIANARHQYDLDSADAWQQYHHARVAANLIHALATSAARRHVDDQMADCGFGAAALKIAAKQTFESAKLDAVRKQAKAIADAEQVRADTVATAERTHLLAITSATTTRWQSDVTLRLTTLTNWNLAANTPWTAYQLALATHEVTLVAVKSTAYAGGQGWGFGLPILGTPGLDTDAWKNYQNSVVEAASERDQAVQLALRQYVINIGDGQIDRATELGDANLTLAGDRGDAGVEYNGILSSIETVYATALTTADTTHLTSTTAAQEAYEVTVAGAKATRVDSEQAAEVTQHVSQGVASVARSLDSSQAEADYQVALSIQQANSAETMANSAGTPEAQFQAANYAAQATWIAALATAHATHAVALEQPFGLGPAPVAIGGTRWAVATCRRRIRQNCGWMWTFGISKTKSIVLKTLKPLG